MLLSQYNSTFEDRTRTVAIPKERLQRDNTGNGDTQQRHVEPVGISSEEADLKILEGLERAEQSIMARMNISGPRVRGGNGTWIVD